MYTFVKALHIIIDIAWIAGLLIYPRYKIHQMSGVKGGEIDLAMGTAAIKLRRIILTPSLILAWISGLTLIYLNPAIMSEGWLHTKLLLVFLLSGLHGYLIGVGRKVDAGNFDKPVLLKYLNELPFIIMAGIVILAVTKPF